MKFAVAMEYYECIPVIEGQDRLMDMKIADYPRAKQDSRKKFFRDIRKQAFPQGLQKKMDFSDFIKRMTGGRSDND